MSASQKEELPEMEGQVNSHTDSDEEEDEHGEFVIIRHGQSSRQAETGEEEETEEEERVRYVQKSQPVSECGPEVPDVGEGLDCGKSSNGQSVAGDMSTSMVSAYSQAILDSTYANMSMYAPMQDNSRVDKLEEVFRGELQKNGSVLDQILVGITDLSKEKLDNAELREKLLASLEQNDAKDKEIAELKNTLAEFKLRINKDAEERHHLLENLHRLSNAYAEKDLQMDHLSAEKESEMKQLEADKDKEIEQLEAKVQQLWNEKVQLGHLLEEANSELSHKDSDRLNQAEIIKILQEENVESVRAVDTTRQRYRDRLDALEQQLASYHARNEVNFP